MDTEYDAFVRWAQVHPGLMIPDGPSAKALRESWSSWPDARALTTDQAVHRWRELRQEEEFSA